jgi:phage FluMu gp28-like protein
METIKLYRPHTKQIPIHEACNDKSTLYITVNAGRQSGKTALSQQQALYWSLSKSKMITYWVSPVASQAQKVYKQILEMIVNTPFIKSYKGSQGDIEIVFKNNSVIKFRSGAQENSLRGESVDYLIIDEAAFIKESTYQEILLPMLNVRGKKVLIISTPKGKNWFFRQYNRGIIGEDGCMSYKFTSLENPYSNPRIIQSAKDSMPSLLYRQEYLGEFVDNAAVIENIEELAIVNQINSPVPGDTYYIGIDVALKSDYNVTVIMNQHDEVVHMDRVNNISAPALKERLVSIFNLWKPIKIYIEENNQGLPIIQDLKQIHKIRNIQGFLTTSKSKPEIINHLINAFASKKIMIIDDDVLKSELEMFTMSISPSGHVKFAAPDGFHDDCVMALAIAWECLQKHKGSGLLQVYKI